MKERIEELKLKAIDFADATYKYDLSKGFQIQEWDAIRLNEFAKLIVQECMNICVVEKADYDKCRKGAWDFTEKNIYSEGASACDTVRIKMKHRFGVE